MKWLLPVASFAFFLALSAAAMAQVCPQPPVLERATGKNIFSDQQEIDLGDVSGESLAHEFTLIDDPALTAHLEELGARLARYLPPNQLRFRFFLVDLSEVNAFSLAGGRIYVARKLVALTRSDDELAGVLAHEMGHIVTHQQAIQATRALKLALGVTEVGDRADIYDKFQRLLENERRKPIHVSGESQGNQYMADQVALFAMARAGFAPQAYVDLWDRFNETHGKTGSWVSDLFGQTKPEEKRLRELLKSVSAMPAECAQIAPSSSADFTAWQAKVIGSSTGVHAESLPGLLVRQKLALPLRPDINNLHFSPNGKYVLAQDEGGIHVLTRDPLEFLFFIEAPGADKAFFTPDSKSVAFKSPSLRVEVWDIASQRRTSVNEILLRVGCLQSVLSPDAKYLACLDRDLALQLVEVASGKQIASKKDFVEIRSLFFLFLFALAQAEEENVNLQLARLKFSPDGRYFVGGSGTNVFAYDLFEAHEARLSSSVRNAAHGEFTFMNNQQILGLNGSNPGKSALISFPSGQHVEEVRLAYGLNLEATPQGKYVVVGPLKSGKRGFMDPVTGKLNGVCKEDACDIYDNTAVFEEIDGRILLIEMPSGKVTARAQLKQAHLGENRAVTVSGDFNWLAASTRSRGAVWDISQNARVQYVRAFTGGWFGDADSFFADFPEQDKIKRSIVKLDKRGAGGDVFSIGDLLASQEGPFLLVRTPAKDNPYQRKDWTYELRDFRTKTSFWTRRFPQEPPSFTWNADYTAVLLGWPVSSAAAHEEMKQFPDLKGTAEREDMFYELVEIKSNSPIGKAVVKTNKFSFRVKGSAFDGEWAAFSASGDRVLIYSLASGKELGHVFGSAPIVSSAGGIYAVTSSEAEVFVYGLEGSRLRRRYKFAGSVAYKRFSSDGRRLFVLTRDQTAYVLDLSAASESQEGR